MEAVTNKLVGDKTFNLRVAFGRVLSEHGDLERRSVHRYVYQFPENLLPKFKRLCAEKNITIIRESKKEFSHFVCSVLEGDDGKN